MSYRRLDPERIISTLNRLQQRIAERFPGRGLNAVCAELLDVAREDSSRASHLNRPIWALRLAVAAVFLTGIGVALAGVFGVFSGDVRVAFEPNPESLEALINITLLSAAGIWFLLNLETRLKRARALSDLHELRSISHVIDMHQLTKDPLADPKGSARATASSPERNLTSYELGRYLDYCSEMLSVVAKLAALYSERARDPVVIQAVDEIQDLTSALSRKIWQKIMLIGPALRTETATPAPPPRDTANRNASPLHPFALGEEG